MIKLRVFAVVAGVLACASVDNLIVAEPGTAFSLPLGRTATVSGSGSRVTFLQVSEDSRCPTSVVCVWAGDARIRVIVSRAGRGEESQILSLSQPNNEARIGNLVVRFVNLAPYPETPDPNTPRAYVAELVVRTP
jgi:hypothetical protein